MPAYFVLCIGFIGNNGEENCLCERLKTKSPNLYERTTPRYNEYLTTTRDIAFYKRAAGVAVTVIVGVTVIVEKWIAVADGFIRDSSILPPTPAIPGILTLPFALLLLWMVAAVVGVVE